MRAFDEVMIVNPYDPSTDGEGEKLMFGHYGWPGFGYYADPYAYAEAPATQADSYGYADPYAYGDPYGYAAGYGYADPYAYADPYYGYGYGYADPYGYAYAPEASELQDAQTADFAQDDPSMYGIPDDAFDGYGGYGGYGCHCGGGGYGQGYAQGYGQPEAQPADSFAEDDINGYADPYGYGYGGYVAERPPRFNAGCPLPVNVGIGDDESINGYEGYVPTADVNASCSGFKQGPASPADVPDTFRPLW